jgi:hypothetical protein
LQAGNISYEFASRGSSPISVDGDFGCVKFIKQTAEYMIFLLLLPKAMFLKF